MKKIMIKKAEKTDTVSAEEPVVEEVVVEETNQTPVESADNH